MILKRREAINAVKKLSISKPGVQRAASNNIKALITHENNPRVRIEIGNVKSFKIGFIVMFISPITSTAMIAYCHSVISKPGRNLARISNVMTFTINHLSINLLYTYLYCLSGSVLLLCYGSAD
jgi:hypothetical protein